MGFTEAGIAQVARTLPATDEFAGRAGSVSAVRERQE